MGGLSRRFLNVIVDNQIAGVQTLRCIDLMRHKLFNTTTPVLPVNGNGWRESEQPQQMANPWVNNHKNNIGMIRLPAPIVHFQGTAERLSWYIDCFPLGGRKVLCVDTSGHTLLFDTVTRQLSMDMPNPHKKFLPVPIFVPGSPTAEDTNDCCGAGHGSIYIMEASPAWEETIDQPSNHYEAFIYQSSKSTATETSTSWKRQQLPPPPFVCDPKVVNPTITSYAVLHGAGGSGSHICISGNDGAGTYCLDTAKHTWNKVGNWTLPFMGKAEYVPQLKLWFGIVHGGSMDFKLGAADLSTMGSQQPQLVGTWKELEVPQGWRELTCPQFANLGSGRFCITRFFCRATIHPHSPDLIEDEYFTVLTGVDVVQRVLDHTNNVDGGAAAANATYSNGNDSNGLKLQLQMIKHNSRRHTSHSEDGSIKLVF